MKIYEGNNEGPATPGVVTVREDDGPRRPLRHHVRHSPTGFSWGYGGSGPAELARCVLIDCLDLHETESCAICQTDIRRVRLEEAERGGPPKIVPASDDPCRYCGSHERDGAGPPDLLPVSHQDFKSEVVAHWPKDKPWEVTSELVDAWCAYYVVRSSKPRDPEGWWPTRFDVAVRLGMDAKRAESALVALSSRGLVRIYRRASAERHYLHRIWVPAGESL
jgi:hypothetical protein